jgi:hypothetical protein
MSLKGQVDGADWTITCHTEETSGGFACSIGVEHRDVEGGRFMHRFRHARTFASEHEAMVAGLDEGLTWIGLKTSKTIGV